MRTRRTFLLECSTLSAAAALVPVTTFGLNSWAPRHAASWGQPSFASFVRHVNTRFVLREGSSILAAVYLVEASVQPMSAGQEQSPDAHNEKFSLLFLGYARESLAQDTYRFEHHALGNFDMFIVPLFSRDPRISYYEAIFNRQVPSFGAKRSIAFR